MRIAVAGLLSAAGQQAHSVFGTTGKRREQLCVTAEKTDCPHMLEITEGHHPYFIWIQGSLDSSSTRQLNLCIVYKLVKQPYTNFILYFTGMVKQLNHSTDQHVGLLDFKRNLYKATKKECSTIRAFSKCLKALKCDPACRRKVGYKLFKYTRSKQKFAFSLQLLVLLGKFTCMQSSTTQSTEMSTIG